jgi:hypothetical protein
LEFQLAGDFGVKGRASHAGEGERYLRARAGMPQAKAAQLRTAGEERFLSVAMQRASSAAIDP